MTSIQTAVVTGGAGFIGSHIVDHLIARGIQTIVIDNFSTGSISNLAAHERSRLLRVVKGEVSEIGSLLADEDVDVVFHEAAIASVQRSMTEPLVVHEVNVNASLRVMNFCVSRGVGRLVFASSAAVYGALNGTVASEDLPCSPSSPYGASKLAVEVYLSAFRNAYGLETVALRYFNVYGPRQSMNDYSGVITVFAKNLRNRRPSVIYGDGAQTRDFIHVTDIARANMLAMEKDSADGQVFNVASGSSTSVAELYDKMRAAAGAGDLPPTFEPARRGDVKSGAASIAKIGRLMGFRPSIELGEGLETVLRQPVIIPEARAELAV